MTDFTEQHYFNLTDLAGEGEPFAAEEYEAALREIDGFVCRCGVLKLPGQPLCTGCYWSLPVEIRSKLYRVKAFGDLWTYDEAKRLLLERKAVQR